MLSPELDALIVENVGDIDATSRRVWKVEELVFDQLALNVRLWADENGWDTEYEEGLLSLWPLEWVIDEDPYGWLVLLAGAGDTWEGVEGEDYYGLTRLIGAGSGQLGFRLDWPKGLRQANAIRKAQKQAVSQPEARRCRRTPRVRSSFRCESILSSSRRQSERIASTKLLRQ